MRQRIKKLADASASLEPGRHQRTVLQEQAAAFADRFYDSVPKQKAYARFDKTVNELLEEPIGEGPTDPDEVLQQVENRVIPPGLNPVSGGHFGYIPGGGLLTSAIGDYLAAVTNRYASVYFSSPGAVVLETRLVNWMAGLIGYGAGAGGYLASGGSMANLTAIVTAREEAGIHPKDVSESVVYLTQQAHHCVERGLNVAGMSECIKRFVPMDEQFRLIPEKLREAVEADRKKGLNPWMVAANAGSTDTGAVDPLHAIGEISGDLNLWFHVDAAYGGFFLLTEKGAELLKGIDKADSVVLDPHKGLFLPYGLGALVVKDAEKLARAHDYHADYMQDTRIEAGVYSPADVSPELSRHFRGLRMWMPLKIHGVQAFRSSLEEKLLLARYAWKQISEMDGFECGPAPDLSVVTFRYNPGSGDIDKLNRELHKRIVDRGKVFFSTTQIHGKFMLRLAVLSVRTHLDHIDLLLSELREHADSL